jgi:hypothetical protein
MKTQYQSVIDLAQAVEDARKSKRDLIADSRELTVQNDGTTLAINSQGVFPIDDYSHHQIAERVGIPAKYAAKMRTEAPDLYAANVNRWFRQNPERRMVRTLRGNVRAFLSDRYQRIENEKVLATILPVFKDHPELQFQSMALTGSRMYLKATLPTLRGEIKVGDIVEAGIEVRNGEIGNSMFEAWPFANRLVCKNGMRFPVGGFKKLHVGARADTTEDVYEMLSDETLQADDTAFLLKARDVVMATLSSETFDKLLGKMKEAAGEKIEGDPVKAVEVLTDQLSLNEAESGNVLRHLIEGGDLSRWGIANAVTRTAQDIEDYDRSDELEGFGGRIVELGKTEWREIVKAA